MSIDGNAIQTNAPGGTNYAVYSISFTATAGTHVLAFVGADLAGGENTVFLDNVQFAIVAPPIANFSFEMPSVGNYQYNPSGGSWAFGGSPGSGSGILANGSGFGNLIAPLGGQAAFFQGSGTIVQSLSNFTPSEIYQLSYLAAQRASNARDESWSLKIDGTVNFVNTGPTNGTPYPYVVIALNPGGESSISNQVCATPTTGSSAAFAIPSDSFDFAAHQLQLTFPCDAGAMYRVTSSTDLAN